MGVAEAINYDYDVIDTPTETTDKIVRCFTDSELNDELPILGNKERTLEQRAEDIGELKGILASSIASGLSKVILKIPVRLLAMDTAYQIPERTERSLGKLLKEWDYDSCDPLWETFKTEEILNEVLAEEKCFSIKDLAINGKDIMELGVKEGPDVGKWLKYALDEVINDRLDNDKEDILNDIDAKLYAEREEDNDEEMS